MSNSTNDLAVLAFDDDDAVTSLDGAAFAPPTPRHDSYIGARPQAESVLDAVRGRHADLTTAIGNLEQTCSAYEAVDVSASAAQTSLRRRVGSLSLLCTALDAVASYAEEPTFEPLFANEGLLAPYLAGVYLWAGDVTDTLGVLARDLNILAPNWAAFRERLGDVAWIHDMAVAEGRRLDGVIDLVPADLHNALDELLIAVITLRHKLDEPFG